MLHLVFIYYTMYSMTTLTQSLSLEPSQLFVADIATMTRYYRDLVGLDVLEATATRTLLGHDSAGAIELIAKPKLAHANPRDAGLFHNAIVYDEKGSLARAAASVLTKAPHLFTGTGDHLVSEAFYFNDPEGNGLELYYDRPDDQWQWHDGHVKMDTLYIDPVQFIQHNANDYGSDSKKLGHVHLRVGNIAEAHTFYIETLGFTRTATFPGAIFMSVAGYHHHIAVNTWMSEGATRRQMSLGLSDVTISLDTADDVSALATRLEQNTIPFTLHNGILVVHDPWGNQLTFHTT